MFFFISGEREEVEIGLLTKLICIAARGVFLVQLWELALYDEQHSSSGPVASQTSPFDMVPCKRAEKLAPLKFYLFWISPNSSYWLSIHKTALNTQNLPGCTGVIYIRVFHNSVFLWQTKEVIGCIRIQSKLADMWESENTVHLRMKV